jgi:hypothetical protein
LGHQSRLERPPALVGVDFGVLPCR